MKPALGYKRANSLISWQQIPAGEELKAKENRIISERLKLSFGHHLLKIGALASELDCSDCLIEHQINLCPQSSAHLSVGIIAEFDDLPLQNNAIDTVLLTHVLEYSVDPHHVLREAHRVLLPNGTLILSVFNPWSLLIIGRWWPFKRHSEFWLSRLFGIPRIKDWLHLLGFEIIDLNYECYSSFLSSSNKVKQGWLAKLVGRFIPQLGSVCVIVARKREWPLTPIRPRLRYRTSFSPAVRSASVNSLIKD